MPRIAVLLVAALACALAAALPVAAAQAATASVTGDQLLVSDASNDTNDLVISASATAFVVSELGGGVGLGYGAGCTPTALNEVRCARAGAAAPTASVYMGDGGTGQRVTVQGAIAAQLEGGTGREILRGGASSDFIRGGGGDDELFGGDSSGAPDVLIGGAGNDLLDGQDGPDRMSGGAGGDILRDTSTQETRDTAEYFTPAGQPDDFRTTGVRVSLGDGRNDGSVEDELVPGDGGFKDDVEGSVTAIAGTDFADVLVGNDLPNSISGFGGADDITGGGGADTVHGHAGSDTLRMRDGVPDAHIDCNNSDGSRGTGPNTAIVDPSDPVSDCSTVDTGAAGGTPSGGSGTTGAATPRTPGDAVAKKGVVVFPDVTLTFPDFLRGTRLCGAKRYCREAEVKRWLDKRKLHYDLESRPATKKALEKAAGRKVTAGEVLLTDPEEGDQVKSGARSPFRVRVYTFSPADIARCNLARPFVRIAGRLVRLTDLLANMAIGAAEQALREAGCKREQYEIVDKVVRSATDPVVRKVKLVGSAKRRIELTVEHGSPEIQFAYTKPRIVSGYLPAMWGPGQEVIWPAGQPVTLAVAPTKAGVGLKDLWVTLRDGSGRQVEFDRTRGDGITELDAQVDATGRYELWSSLCDAENDCIVGWKRIDVARLDTKRQYLGLDGLTYGYSGGRWKAVATAAAARGGGPVARVAQAAASDREALGRLAGQLVTGVARSPLFIRAQRDAPGGVVARAVATLNGAATAAGARGGFAGYFDALVQRGVEFTVLAGAGNGPTTVTAASLQRGTAIISDGTRVASISTTAVNIHDGALGLKVGPVVFVPGGVFYVVSGGGTTTGPVRRAVPVSPLAPNLDLVPLGGTTGLGLKGVGSGALVGADGGSLVGMDGASLIGMDGATLVGMDGASLIGMDGSSLVGADGGSLIGMDGASLIGMDGST